MATARKRNERGTKEERKRNERGTKEERKRNERGTKERDSERSERKTDTDTTKHKPVLTFFFLAHFNFSFTQSSAVSLSGFASVPLFVG
jgi:hypothetical protein